MLAHVLFHGFGRPSWVIDHRSPIVIVLVRPSDIPGIDDQLSVWLNT